MSITEKIEKYLTESKPPAGYSDKCGVCGEPATTYISRKGKKSSWCSSCYDELAKDLKTLPRMF